MTHVYGRHAPAYVEAGLTVLPVDPQKKKPLVKGWGRATRKASQAWIERFAECDGIGVVLGPKSGITEVDVDMIGDAHVAQALDCFGETPIVIRTPTGKSKLWYRHEGEGRQIRPAEGIDIDVLGAGLTVAPPSRRVDLHASYEFVRGSLADIGQLPPLRKSVTERCLKPAETVRVGERNNRLWRWCMSEARHCDDLDALIDAAETYSQGMLDPLPRSEVKKAARSAWSYEVSGRNFVGHHLPQANSLDRAQDLLSDEPRAFFLYSVFYRYHKNKDSFRISPQAMQKAGNPPWDHKTIRDARDVLLERGLLEELEKPGRGWRAGSYRLAT